MCRIASNTAIEVQVERDFALESIRRLLQRLEADDAPGAGDVGDEVDLAGGGHGGSGK